MAENPTAILHTLAGAPLATDGGDRLTVNADALPLPAGATTEAKLEAVRAILATIDADTGALVAKDFATEASLAALLTNNADIETILTAIRDTAGIKKITDGVALNAGSHLIGTVKLRGSDGLFDVNVDASHRLSTTSAVVIPAGFTEVSEVFQAIVTGNGSIDNDHVVPAGKTLSISQFFGGGEVQVSKSSKFELYHSTDGGTTDGALLAFGYIGGGSNNFRVDLNYDVLGVGTDQLIRMRRVRLDGVSLELAAGWIGIEAI